MQLDDKLAAFEEKLEEMSQRKLEDFFAKMSKIVLKNFKTSTHTIFAECFQNCTKDFWVDVERLYMEQMVDAVNEFDKQCGSFSKSELLTSAKDCLENEMVSIYRENLLSETNKSTVGLRFTKLLDKNFRFDSSGRPRHWENLIMIDDAYDKAITKVQ